MVTEIRAHSGHIALVIEDTKRGKIAAAGSAVMERKFIRDGSYVCHIEDIVVDSTIRKGGFGKT